MIVVTGAAGFIGSNVLAEFEAEGRGPLAAVDWMETGEKWRNLAKRRIAAFVHPDQLLPWLDAHAGEVRLIVHMGAISATTESDVDRLVRLNINYTVSLWDWCTHHRVPFIYASSAATYGGIESRCVDDDSVAALSSLQPLNAYGWSKKATDIIFAERRDRGEPTPPQWIGLKFFNVYGPNEYHKGDMMSVAAKMFDMVMRGDPVRLFKSYRPDIADGEQRRDFVYVKDCTRTISWLIDHPDVSGIFNVGSGKAQSFLEIVTALQLATNRPIDVEFIDMPESLRGRYQYFTEADMAKAAGFGIDTSFRDLNLGVQDYVVNYLTRGDRFR
ncbi:MAG: ADP-glyceromanno-heptose 6-epimerase [Ancalomicrobiaceae bacterium]|nr:ADP-glyceromanno-heptose 6-epimerase [Ancalomicrobiaceae bacterium]